MTLLLVCSTVGTIWVIVLMRALRRMDRDAQAEIERMHEWPR